MKTIKERVTVFRKWLPRNKHRKKTYAGMITTATPRRYDLVRRTRASMRAPAPPSRPLGAVSSIQVDHRRRRRG